MIKPASLRRALVAAIPSLETEPDKLAVFIDEGSIAATGTLSLSFEYRYTLHALVMDFAGDSDTVFVALVEWVRANQPDLVTNPREREHGITFEVDVLNNETADLSIKLLLTESVVVSTGPDGKRVITHVDDSQVDANGSMTWVAQP
ncbi:phage tail protein [Burkholderia ubonensis]|uniref:phage tail protein n=1 Tax=Burkholderia ubonensis TaxID=101571 RepID=UPI000753C5E9|nr:phage tail protein [Burkholderia ubonensis]KWC22756.1 phage tail protein [Burkholderia ubonensis]KWC34391.1 phage tail protein [Burkholderia ubonensis]